MKRKIRGIHLYAANNEEFIRMLNVIGTMTDTFVRPSAPDRVFGWIGKDVRVTVIHQDLKMKDIIPNHVDASSKDLQAVFREALKL